MLFPKWFIFTIMICALFSAKICFSDMVTLNHVEATGGFDQYDVSVVGNDQQHMLHTSYGEEKLVLVGYKFVSRWRDQFSESLEKHSDDDKLALVDGEMLVYPNPFSQRRAKSIFNEEGFGGDTVAGYGGLHYQG